MPAHHQLLDHSSFKRSERRLRSRVDREGREVRIRQASDAVAHGVRDRVGTARGNLSRCLVRRALLDLAVHHEGGGGRERAVPCAEGQRSRVGTREADCGAHLSRVADVDVVDLGHVDDDGRRRRRRGVLAEGNCSSLGDGLSGSLRGSLSVDVHERLTGQLGREVLRRLRLDLSEERRLDGSLEVGVGVGVEACACRASCLCVARVRVVPSRCCRLDVVRHLRDRLGLEDEVLDDLDLAVDLVTDGLLGLDLDLVPALRVVVPAVRALDEHLPLRVGLPVPHLLVGGVVVGRPQLHGLMEADLVTLHLRLGGTVGLDP